MYQFVGFLCKRYEIQVKFQKNSKKNLEKISTMIRGKFAYIMNKIKIWVIKIWAHFQDLENIIRKIS